MRLTDFSSVYFLCSHLSDVFMFWVYHPVLSLQRYATKKCRFPLSSLFFLFLPFIADYFRFAKVLHQECCLSGFCRFLSIIAGYCRLLPVILTYIKHIESQGTNIVHTWNNPLHGKTGLRCKERNFRKKGSIKEVETSLT